MADTQFRKAFLHPKYWLLWIGFGLWWCLVQLPYPILVILGKGLGRLMFMFGGRRKRIAEKNLELCFPDLDNAQRQALLKENFIYYGLAFFEVGISWWWPNKRIRKLVQVEGLEHLQNLHGQGALLLGLHLTTLEIGMALSLFYPANAMHRPHKNPVYEYLQVTGRKKRSDKTRIYPRDDIRGTIKALRKGEVIWYAPDQDYGIKHGIFAPFMGVNAATIVATTRLAETGKAKVIPFSQRHLPGYKGYLITIHPPLKDFPTGDDYQDAVTVNNVIEKLILQQPAAYLWAHRRFKTRPPGEASFYS